MNSLFTKLRTWLLAIAMLLTFNAFSAEVIIGTSTSNQQATMPFYGYYDYGWSAMIYNQNEIGSPGTITALEFQKASGSAYTIYTQRVYMAIVSDSIFNSTAYITPTSVNATEVYYGNVYWTSSNTFQGITLQTPFNYTGGNLLVLWENRDGSYSSGNPTFHATATANYKAKWRYTDGSFPASSGTLSITRPNTRITYTPSTAIDLAVTQWVFPTNGSSASSSMPISIQISNLGGQAQNNFTVKYSINNGSTWAQQTVTSTLAVGGNMNLTFITPANMSSPGVYQCIAVVNKTGDTINSNDTLRQIITICGGAYSGTYIIGNQSGDHFPTLESAFAAIKSCGISGNITLKLRAGTYGKIAIPYIASMSASNNITIETYSGQKDVIITNSSNSTNYLENYAVKLDSAKFYTLKNLTIKAFGTTSAFAILVNQAQKNTITNCVIEGDNLSTSNNYYFSSIYNYNSYDYARQNVYSNNVIRYGSYGYYQYGTNGYNYGDQLIGNTLENYRYYGIYTYYEDSLKVKNNQFSTNSTAVTAAITVNYCDAGLDISSNKIEVNRNYGIDLYYCQASSSSNAAKVYNNWIYGDVNLGGSLYGMRLYQSYYADVEHNSIYIVNYGINSYTSYGIYMYYGSYVMPRNNSIVNEANSYTFYVYNTTMSNFDYNNLYSNGSYLCYYNGNRTTLSALQSATSTNLNSVSSSGVYYSATNLHSNSSALNNLGTGASTVAYDIDGQTRSNSTPDIGADEFEILSNDGGLLSFSGITNQCAGTTIPLVVSFKNFGTQAITSAYIKGMIAGTNYGQAWSGYLNPGSSTNIYLGTRVFSSDTVYTLTAWVDSVNHQADANDFNDTVKLANYRTSLSGNYVVGASSSADFASISDAFAAFNQYGICGPVVLNMEAGIYNVNQSITAPFNGMSAVNTVTIRSLSGDTADVTFQHTAASTSNNYIFNLENAPYFRFSNVTFKALGQNYNTALRIYNSPFTTVDSCLFVHPSGSTSSYSRSMDIYTSGDLKIRNNSMVNSTYGLFLQGNSSSYTSDIRIENNDLRNIGGYGFYLQYFDTAVIANNTIRMSQVYNNLYGIYMANANYSVDIHGNDILVISDYNAYGMYLYYINYTGYSSAAQIKIYNNFIKTNSTYASGYSYGIYSYYTYYNKLYFNTINSEGTSTTTTISLYSYYSYYHTLVNNIFSSNVGYAYYRYYGSVLASDYNDFYTGGSVLIRYNTTYYYNLPSYVSYYGYDTHSKSVDPGFVAANDLHIFNQVLNDAGTPYAGVTTDIDGETRSLYLPDIGADEYSILSRDIKPIAVNSPANPAAIGNNQVKVSIKNQGTTTLYSANIFFRLDGGTIDSNYWVGNIGFLGVDSLIDLGSVNLTSGSHTLKVWTKNPNGQSDLNPSNDTLTYTFNAIPKPIIEVKPTSIIDTLLACSGTLNQSFKVYNRGSANLTYSIDANSSANDSIHILAILTGYYSTTWTNTKSLITNNLPKAKITEVSVLDAASLTPYLAGKDIVFIPRVGSSSSTYLNAYTSFGPVLQNFVSNGGTVIFQGSQGTTANSMFNTGLFTGSYYGYLSSSYTVNINQPGHDIFDGITGNTITTNYYYTYYTLTSPNTSVLAYYSSTSYPVIAERTLGQGKVILLGFDNYYTSTEGTAMLVNSIEYGYTSRAFIVNNAVNQTLTPGDSATVNISFVANGLNNGWNTDQIEISHNDQSQSNILIPCSLYVDGDPEIDFNKTFHSFGSVFVNNSVTDSIYFVNEGCADLIITGVSSNNSYLTPLRTNDTIAPGDSTAFHFKFQPLSTGSYVMTVTVYNNDSNRTLTFAGTATPAPAISFNPNPLSVTLTNCADSVIVPVTITNTGGALLTGSISSGSDSLEVLMLTYGAYNTSYLVDALDHTFTKFNLSYSSASASSQLQTDIQGMDVVVIPYINSTSYYTVYSSFSTILQNFANAGGTVIYAGQYYPNYLTAAGFFSGSYVGYDDYVNVTVNTNHPITNGLTATTYVGNEDFLYWNMTNTGRTDLITFNNYTVSSIVPYGDGYAVYLGFYYIGYSTQYSYTLASNALQYVYNEKARWLDYQPYNFSINPGNSAVFNVKFRSQNINTGIYNTNISVNTNIPGNSLVQLPCTVNIKNELNAGSFLGPDTSYCGPKLLDAGSGYSSYLWNTASTSQTQMANVSGFYMVTITNGGVCSSRDTVLVTINPLPNAVISGLPSSACTNGSGIQMTGTPSGGGFIGNGVNGSIFYPANVATGPHNVTYTYTNSYGCTDTDVKTVTVYNPPTVLATGLSASYCPQGTSSTLTGAPAGGTFSGNGMNGNIFVPSLAGSGTKNVYYSYTDLHGCSNTDTLTTTVLPYVQANLSGILSHHCINDIPVSISSSISGTNYNGPGIIGTTFYPGSAGAGTHNIFYSYSDNNNCNYQDTFVTTVHALPSGVTLSGLNADYCYDEGNESLSGYPLGGVFSGSGVTGSVFNTMSAGAGTHNVVYTYTDVYGCSNSDTASVVVHALPLITFTNLNPSYCISQGNINLSATPAGGTFSGTAVVGNVFNTQTAGVGSHYVKYSYTDTYGCYNEDSISIVVNPNPTVNFSGLPATTCSNGSIANLVGSPSGGVFSGNGVVGTTFNPAFATSGTNQITYTYTDNNGCIGIKQHSVNVVQTQQVNIGPDQTIPNNTTTQFNPIISGGTGPFTYAWTPSNKVNNAAILNPTTVQLTQATQFVLTVTSTSSSCVAKDTAIVNISGGALSISLNASQTTICEGETVSLQALGSGGSGTYTYSWSSNPAGFTATTSQVNVYPSVTTIYTCQANDGTNNISQSVTITVKPSPNAQIAGLASAYCTNDGLINLTATPTGGSFTGSGVSGNTFSPAMASIGINTITYSITAANGCSDQASQQVEVKQAPTASAGSDTILPCQNTGVQLGQQPFGGVSYGWYPVFGLNNPNIANPTSTPNYPVTYILTATASNGCTETDTVNIGVVGGPNATVSNDTMICAGETVILNVSGGTSYQWSTGDTTSSITVSPTKTTQYFVIATQSNCADLDTILVTVNQPKPHLPADTSICAGNTLLISPGIFPSYLWSTSATSPFISVDSTGIGFGSTTITVEVTDNFGCTNSDTIVVTFKNCTGFELPNGDDLKFTVYPNPTDGRITLKSGSTTMNSLTYRIVDITGKELISGELINSLGFFEQGLDLSILPKGVYMIHLIGNQQSATMRITIQ